MRPKSTWDLLWAPDEAPKGKACPKGELPRVVDVDCNPVPLGNYVIIPRPDDHSVLFDVQILREKGIPKGYDYFHGEAVKVADARALSTDQLTAIHRWRRGHGSLDAATLAKAKALFPESSPLTKDGPVREKPYCGTLQNDPVLALIEARPDYTRKLGETLFKEDHAPLSGFPGEVRYGRVVVHERATTELDHPTPLCDGNAACSGTGVARTFAERVGQIADYAIDVFTPFMPNGEMSPIWTTKDPLHIYLDGSSGHGATDPFVDYIYIDQRVVNPKWQQAWGIIPHEIFHQIQYSYQRSDQGAARKALIEGGAVWAEDLIHPDYNHYVSVGASFLGGVNTTPPLLGAADAQIASEGGAGSDAEYSASIFWKFLEEQRFWPRRDPIAFGREMLSQMGARGHTIQAIKGMAEPVGGLDEIWTRFLITNYVHGFPPRPEFDYLESTHPVLWAGSSTTLGTMRVKPELVEALKPTEPAACGRLRPWSACGRLRPWSARYLLLRPRSPMRVDVEFVWQPAARAMSILAVLPVEVNQENALVRATSNPVYLTGKQRFEIGSALLMVVSARDEEGRFELWAAPAD